MDRQLPWYYGPLRIADFIPPAEDTYVKMDMDAEYAARASLGFNAEHITVHATEMGESGVSFFRSPHDEVERRDMLADYLARREAYHKRMMVYWNVHWIDQLLMDKHPGWSQRDEAGEVIPSAYGSGAYFCVNSGFRDYLLETLRALAQYPIDGVFLDGPIFYEMGCFCDACRERFEKQFGYPLGKMPAQNTPEWEDWFLLKRQSIAHFVKEARDALKSVRPEALIYMNSPQLLPGRLCARDNRMTEPFQDMLLAEGGFLYGELEKTPVWKPAASAMLLECQSGGKPYVIAIAGRQGPWSRYFLAGGETRLAHWFAVAHGAWTWYGVYNECAHGPMMDTVAQVNAFLAGHEEYYTQTASVAKTALLWSASTANHQSATSEKTDFTSERERDAADGENDMKKAFDGWFELLSRSQRAFDIVDEEAIAGGGLAGCELLILPGAACLPRAVCEVIARYVENGGGLIATFNTGLYDETGAPYEAPPLARVLGAKGRPRVRHNPYEHIAADGAGLFSGIRQKLIPSAHLGVLCEAAPGAVGTARYRAPQTARYCPLPGETEYPYIVTNRFGKGKSIWFTANVDGFFSHYKLPEYKRLLQNAVEAFRPPEVVVEAPCGVDSIHVSLRAQPGRLMLHIINYTAAMARPIQKVLRLENLAVCVRTALRPARVHALAAGQPLPFTVKEDGIEVCLPYIDDYEVLVLEEAE